MQLQRNALNIYYIKELGGGKTQPIMRKYNMDKCHFAVGDSVSQGIPGKGPGGGSAFAELKTDGVAKAIRSHNP